MSGFEPGEREGLEARVGYRFADDAQLLTALTHPSFAYEDQGGRGNERLEFLGDAVIDLVVAQLLYEAHPDWPEGNLTRARRALVNAASLAEQARRLDLGAHVRLGHGERKSGGSTKESILGNAFEALVGAVYLDGGIDPCIVFLRRAFGAALEADGELPQHDPKTRFQEWSVAAFRTFPEYQTVEDSGVENDTGRFAVEVRVGPDVWGQARGRTKREAEQGAAASALERAGQDP